MKHLQTNRWHLKRAAVAVQVAVMMPVIVGFAALTIDVGLIFNAKTDLQLAADAAALAGTALLPQVGLARTEAIRIAELSKRNSNAAILVAGDADAGNWDTATNTYTAGALPFNALRVTARRAQANGNPVSLFFSKIWGIDESNVTATAIAVKPSVGEVRFLIDDEVFDTDEPAIEDLADRLGTTTDDLLSDANFDGFIDIPAGEVLILPTGQVGDEGLKGPPPELPGGPIRETGGVQEGAK